MNQLMVKEKLNHAILDYELKDCYIEYGERPGIVGSAWYLRSLEGGGIYLGHDEQSALLSIIAVKAERDRGR
jgi:hypothetical protein